MALHVHGQPGTSFGTSTKEYGSPARRGACSERRVGTAVQAWLGNLLGASNLLHGLVRPDHAAGADLDRSR